MTYQRFYIILLLLALTACEPKQDILEIPQEKLVMILADVHIIEGALLSILPSEKDSLKTLYYQQVFEIHEVSEEAFDHDVKILKLNPKLMEQVYEEVLGELDRKNKDFDKNKKEKKK